MGKRDFKYIVIGSGPAGTGAALTLARAKKSVALVEAHFFGGANLNTRDVPYGVALDFSHHYSKLYSYPEIKNHKPNFKFSAIPARELSAIIQSGGNSRKLYDDAGVICLNGFATFLDPHTIKVGNKQFTAEYFILATGAKLDTKNITGTNFVKYLAPEEAIKITRLPEVVAVIGAGSTGCEIASYYAELGANVILFETANQLLPHEDADVSQVITEYFTKQLNINILTNSQVTAIHQDEFSKSVIFSQAGSEKVVRVDTIVLATGSIPSLGYGLEQAKVKYQPTGINVNRLFQTSARHIYAVGDCLGRPDSSTDRAFHEGTSIANNLINGTKTITNYQGIARITSTYPEVAIVGFTEADLAKQKRKYKKSVIKLDETIASKIHHFSYGFVKLLVDHNRHFLGASIVAPNASLLIEEISLAMRHNLTPLELASTPHVATSYNEAIRLAARQLLSKAALAGKKR